MKCYFIFLVFSFISLNYAMELKSSDDQQPDDSSQIYPSLDGSLLHEGLSQEFLMTENAELKKQLEHKMQVISEFTNKLRDLQLLYNRKSDELGDSQDQVVGYKQIKKDYDKEIVRLNNVINKLRNDRLNYCAGGFTAGLVGGAACLFLTRR